MPKYDYDHVMFSTFMDILEKHSKNLPLSLVYNTPMSFACKLEVNRELKSLLEKEPFERMRKNTRKIRTLCQLILEFSFSLNLEGIKSILAYGYKHPLIVSHMVFFFNNKEHVNMLGEWIIQTFRNKREVRPIYIQLIKMNLSLFHVFVRLGISYVIRPRELVDVLKASQFRAFLTDDAQSTSALEKKIVQHIRYYKISAHHPLLYKKIRNPTLFFYCFKNGELSIIRLLQKDFKFSLKDYIEVDLMNYLIHLHRRRSWTPKQSLEMIWFLYCSGVEIRDKELLSSVIEEYKTKFYIFTLINRDKQASEMIPDDIFYEIASKFF